MELEKERDQSLTTVKIIFVNKNVKLLMNGFGNTIKPDSLHDHIFYQQFSLLIHVFFIAFTLYLFGEVMSLFNKCPSTLSFYTFFFCVRLFF